MRRRAAATLCVHHHSVLANTRQPSQQQHRQLHSAVRWATETFLPFISTANLNFNWSSESFLQSSDGNGSVARFGPPQVVPSSGAAHPCSHPPTRAGRRGSCSTLTKPLDRCNVCLLSCQDQASEALEVFYELLECETTVLVPHIRPVMEFCMQVSQRCALLGHGLELP